MKIDRTTLRYMLESMSESVREIHLLSKGKVDKAVLQRMARIAHKLKGEATIVGLANLGALISQFEDYLGRLQRSPKIERTHLQKIGIFLQRIVEAGTRIRNRTGLDKKQSSTPVATPVKPKPVVNSSSGVAATLRILAQNVSRTDGKLVHLNLDKFDIGELPKTLQVRIQDILIQLVRNAIAHGIEVPEKRREQGKNSQGTVAVIVRKRKDSVIVAVRDNGRGIDLEQIRKRLIFKYGMTVRKAAKLTREQLLNALFLPGFSTLAKQQDHAGRGVGLDLVKAYTKELGGSIEVDYKDGESTQFVLQLPLPQNNVAVLPVSGRNPLKKTSDKIPTLYAKHAG
ncbi:Hpt domain-containing protein [Alteromonadaceae bacterium 2753L.S.0a.02]|nr:Hpt domain-containing protein [Alteromonadaceae bacterium 2753L.S.0a.02]